MYNMVDLENLLKKDYEYSYKIAKFLPYDSKRRKFVQLATQTGTAVFWFIGLIAIYFLIPKYRPETFSMFIVTLFMAIPVFILKNTIKRPRPDFKDTRFGSVVFDKWSFPSGHATRATYVMILMSFYMPQFDYLWYVWGVLMISSRLLLGVHYITDILTGVLLSITLISIFLYFGYLPIVPFYEYI